MHFPSCSHTFCLKYVPPLCIDACWKIHLYTIIDVHVQAVRTRMVRKFTWTPKKSRSQTHGFHIIYPQWIFYPTLIGRRKKEIEDQPHEFSPMSFLIISPRISRFPHEKPHPWLVRSRRWSPVFGKPFPAPLSP